MRLHRIARRALVAAALLTAACADDPTRPDPRSPAPRGADAPSTLKVPAPNSYTQVSAGYQYTCARRDDGAVECWGDNQWQQAPTTRLASNGGAFGAVAAGRSVTCALRTDGAAECWGTGDIVGVRTSSSGSPFTQVGVGDGYACALRADHAVECWGANGLGQAPALRTATPTSSHGPVHFTQLSVGPRHACAATSWSSEIQCWGANDRGQAPSAWNRSGGDHPMIGVAAGADLSCSSFPLSGVGARLIGCVGGWGTVVLADEEAYPALHAPSVGDFEVCAISQFDGRAKCWQGTQTKIVRTATDGARFTSVSVGHDHTCALRNDGKVQCFGDDGRGQAPALRTASGTHLVTTAPTATLSVGSASVPAGTPITLQMTALVPGRPEATFTYAFDCGDGAGYGGPAASAQWSCATSAVGTRTVRGRAIDQSGDSVEASAVVQVTDGTPPTVVPNVLGTLGGGGWYRSDVTITWTVTDAESPVTSPACPATVVSADTPGGTVTCSATSGGGTAERSVTVRRDATAPAIAPTLSVAVVTLGSALTATPNATDPLSGVAGTSCGAVRTDAVGPQHVTCTAVDVAGNFAKTTLDYRVLWPFSGVGSPLVDAPAVNERNAGSAAPVTFSLGGDRGLAIFRAGAPYSQPASCTTWAPLGDAAAAETPGKSGLTYDPRTRQYAWAWKTDKAWEGTCRTLSLALVDGGVHVLRFRFR